MKKILSLSLSLAAAAGLLVTPSRAAAQDCGYSAIGYRETPIAGRGARNLCKAYGGKVVLLVNIATQAKDAAARLRALQTFYDKYNSRGLVVLAFPSDDFHHEHAKADHIAAAARDRFGVRFPIFRPIHVIGPDTDFLYRNLFLQAGIPPQHDFDKYLIGRDGSLVGYYSSKVTLADHAFVTVVEGQLAQPKP